MGNCFTNELIKSSSVPKMGLQQHIAIWSALGMASDIFGIVGDAFLYTVDIFQILHLSEIGVEAKLSN